MIYLHREVELGAEAALGPDRWYRQVPHLHAERHAADLLPRGGHRHAGVVHPRSRVVT